jgi:hypothetical protein
LKWIKKRLSDMLEEAGASERWSLSALRLNPSSFQTMFCFKAWWAPTSA